MVSHDAQELELDLSRFNYFDFPPSLTDTKKVRLLRIAIRDTYLRSGCPALISIKCLTSLRLEAIIFQGYYVSDILSVFENLESFSIEDVSELGSRGSVLEIHSLTLKELSLGFYSDRTYWKPQSLEINCPNLTSLVMNHFEVRKIHFRDVSSLDRASVYFSDAYYAQWKTVMKSLAHVKHLSTQNFGPKNHGLFKSPLSNVKHLEIRTSYSKFEYRPPLSEPNLVEESKRSALLEKAIHLQIPNLKLVKIKDFKQTTEEAIFISYLLLHGCALEKILLLHPSPEGNVTLRPIVMRRQLKQLNGENVQHFELRVLNGEIIM
ncbi:hypothetical protein Tsubulata_047471 [Turnera subulata]|uniref:FBD domain-containing protein n=1 Tax=Turnera subulata TaxID=218843 RepID=A0A9Q0GAH4_9ROSI|nr:hypothetical protein Tsubulata_047471 [Turnera subulata]